MPKVTYADEVIPDFGIPFPTGKLRVEKGELKLALSPEEIQATPDEELQTLFDLMEKQPILEKQDPVKYGWTLESWRRVMENWRDTKIHIILGGNRCITGDTPILCAKTGVERPVSSIKGEHEVLSMYRGDVAIAKAGEPFRKGVLPILRVTLEDGSSFRSSFWHMVWDSNGIWRPAHSLRVGDGLSLHPSMMGISLKSWRKDVPHSFQTLEDLMDDCFEHSHLCDELLHAALESCLVAFQRRYDAPIHSTAFDNIPLLISALASYSRFGTKGGQAYTLSHSQSQRLLSHLANLDAASQIWGQFFDILSRASCRPCKSASGSLSDRGVWKDDLQSIVECVLDLSSHGSAKLDSLYNYVLAYERNWAAISSLSNTITSIERVGKEEVWDMEVEYSHNYYAQGCFHHNSTKSTFANRLLVDMAQKIDEAKIYHWHDNEERSVVDAQATIFNSLPFDLREKGQKRGGQNYSVTYNQKTGFVGRLPTCILPPRDGIDRGSSIFFKYYTQYLQNQQVAEGFNAHIIEMDEECPLKLFQTMIPRTVDFHGRIILTFTTLQGWTPLIAELLKGAETVATRYAPTEGRKLPVEQICHAWPSARIYYWWTQDNPFIDSHHLVEQYVNQPVEERLARLYGIPTKTQQGKFPKFNKDVNVVPHGEIPFIKHPDKYPVTRYFITDPAGTKPWVAVWIGVIGDGRVYVYRESPTEEWCQPHVNNAGTPVGKPSVGQKPNGWGYLQWKEHFLGLEQDEEIIQRICDPGFGTQKVTKTDGQTDLFSEMAALDFHMVPVYRGDVEAGVAKINDLLAWNDRKPMSVINRPQLYVSDQCQNTINSMLEYTGCSKEEHFKDFVDTIRYGVTNGLHYCEEGNLTCTGGGGY